MQTTTTVEELSQMDDAAFIAHLKAYPKACMWPEIEAKRYSALRAVMKWGFVIANQDAL